MGSRCIAGPSDSWGPATIRRVNEDGTFTIEFDVKNLLVLKQWYGVTRDELSFNDAALWPQVLRQLQPNFAGQFGKSDFIHSARLLNLSADAARLDKFWTDTCAKLFNVPEAQAADFQLDEASAYLLFTEGRLYAARCLRILAPPPVRHAKVYWNQVRMGGRDPAEIARPVTLEDALAALGIAANGQDAAMERACAALEMENGVTLPGALKRLLCQRGSADAIFEAHPNGPSSVGVKDRLWQVRRDLRQQKLNADFALNVMTHMGEYDWLAVFNNGDEDAAIYVRWDDGPTEHWALAAPTIGMFFWDLAQTGLAWYQETKFKGGKPVRRTDIGLVPLSN